LTSAKNELECKKSENLSLNHLLLKSSCFTNDKLPNEKLMPARLERDQ